MMGSERTQAPVLEGKGISKRFPGVQALQDVDIRLNKGEILCVIGENGAGKSTLTKILGGIHQPDSGEVFVDGEKVEVRNVQDALRLRIGLIHQELNLADNLSVAANVFLGREPRLLGPFGLLDKSLMAKATAKFTQRIGLDCPPNRLVAHLPIAQRQLVEIAKALSFDARILMMDEPTSSLSSKETDILFNVIRQLRSQGVSIVYISHRLSEVKEMADRVMVLRDGRNAGELEAEEIQHDRMVQMMVGRDLSRIYRRDSAGESGPAVLEVRELRTSAFPHQSVSFDVHAGEILGVAGLVGSGRSEMARALFGVDRALRGEVFLDGKRLRIAGCLDAMAAGILLAPEDRKTQGLILESSVRENISLPALRHWQSLGLVDRRKEREVAERMCSMLQIRTPGINQIVSLLSGGNQQKTALAKWLTLEPRVLLLDEPTRGVDVGARVEIFHLMEDLAARGVAIVMISSEMEEILGMSDRVIVMHEGAMAGELSRREISEEAVMQLAAGGSKAAAGGVQKASAGGRT